MTGTPLKLLKPAEVAEMLGVTREEVYALIKKGGLPARRVGNRLLRINEPELLEWWESRGRLDSSS